MQLSFESKHELLKQFAFQNNSIETQNPSRKRSSRSIRSNVITLVCTTTDVVLMQPIKASSQFINTSKELMTTRTSDQKGFSFLIRQSTFILCTFENVLLYRVILQSEYVCRILSDVTKASFLPYFNLISKDTSRVQLVNLKKWKKSCYRKPRGKTCICLSKPNKGNNNVN